jgi:hypothetical protein
MKLVFACLAAWLSLFVQAIAVEKKSVIDWEVKHRFRVIDSRDHDQFIDDYYSYLKRAAEPRGRDAVSGKLERYPAPFQSFYGPNSAQPKSCPPGYRCKLETHYKPERAQYDHDWFHNPRRDIRVRLTDEAFQQRRCNWSIDGAERFNRPCTEFSELPARLGRYKLTATIRAQGALKADVKELDIEIKDIKFAAMGDSVASGEGNPHVTFQPGSNNGETWIIPVRMAEWWDHRCHRSLLSASSQAAIELARKRRDTSVTYVSFACSGATVDVGISGRYQGIEKLDEARDRINVQKAGTLHDSLFQETELPVQATRLRQLLCKVEGQSPCQDQVAPDILSITTGGNEMEFGPQLVDCVLKTCRFPKEKMAGLFAGLDAQLQKLPAMVSSIQARHIFYASYPDVTRDEKRNFCKGSIWDSQPDFTPWFLNLLGVGISRVESERAFNEVLKPLNDAIKAFTLANTAQGWVFVGGYQNDRGYCAKPSWIHRFKPSVDKQGVIGRLAGSPPLEYIAGLLSSGAMHPNVFGHYGIMARLLAEIESRVP